MDLTSTPRAAENRTRWNMNVTKSSVVPKQLSRIEIKSAGKYQESKLMPLIHQF